MEVQGFPNYLIYQDGRVFSKKRQGGGGKFLKPYINSKGYPTVTLTRDSKIFTSKIHRLIGIHYIPNPNNLPFIDHKDRNRQNNNIDNLRWVTPIQNLQNVGISVRNTSGIQNIRFVESQNIYRFEKTIYGKRYSYSSKTLGGVLARKIIFNVLNKV